MSKTGEEYAWGYDYATRDIILSKDFKRVYAGIAYVKVKESDLKPDVSYSAVDVNGVNERDKNTAYSPLTGNIVSNQ